MLDVNTMQKQDVEHPCEAYTQLKLKFRDIGRLHAVGEVLGRDFLTGMPDGAYRSRRNQIAYIERLAHEHIVDEEIRRLLDTAQNHCHTRADIWNDWDIANLREMMNMVENHSYIDPVITESLAMAAHEGRRFHSQALRQKDWATAQHHLQHVVDIERRILEARAKALGFSSLYEAALDVYAPGFTLAEIENWFSFLETALKNLLPKVQEKQNAEEPPIPLTGPFPADAQMWVNRELLKLIGFDFNCGGLYETGHNPVEGGTPDDTRLVIKNVDENDFMDSMKSALHEGGHGIYIQGLPRQKWRYQPVAQDLGATIHESQALIIEMVISRTPGFFNYLSPRLEGLFQGMYDKSLSAENLHKIKTRISVSADRKKADEISYFFHILLRFRIEKDLIEGRAKVFDLPEIWAQEMQRALGITPERVEDGPLQDVHWFVGKFGYFPSYALGHMIAAQFFNVMKSQMPNLGDDILQGDFSRISAWLKKNIHSRGRLMSPKDLVKQACGADVNPQALLDHLTNRYL